MVASLFFERDLIDMRIYGVSGIYIQFCIIEQGVDFIITDESVFVQQLISEWKKNKIFETPGANGKNIFNF